MDFHRNPDLDASEKDEGFEFSLRPQRLGEYIGQEKVKTRLEIALQAAKKRGEVIDHVLLFGPRAWARRPWPTCWPTRWAPPAR